MPDIPIIGQNGHNSRPSGEMYIPGREYLLVVKLDTGDELTVKANFNFAIEQIPDPFVPEEVCARLVAQQAAQGMITRSQEGPWFLWVHVSAFTYLGPADTAGTPKLRLRPTS